MTNTDTLVVTAANQQIPHGIKYVLIDIDQHLRGPLHFQVTLTLPSDPIENQTITIRDIYGLYEKIRVRVPDESKYQIVSTLCCSDKVLCIKPSTSATLLYTSKICDGDVTSWVEI